MVEKFYRAENLGTTALEYIFTVNLAASFFLLYIFLEICRKIDFLNLKLMLVNLTILGVGKIFYEFFNCALWTDCTFNSSHWLYFCYSHSSFFIRVLCVLYFVLYWHSHSVFPLFTFTAYRALYLPKNFCFLWACLQDPALLSLDSSLYLAPIPFLPGTYIFSSFYFAFETTITLVTVICNSLSVWFSRPPIAEAEQCLPLLQHQPLPCCAFTLLLPVHHVQCKQSGSW